MAKYHYNEKLGKIGICRAVYKCPLGVNTPHFKSSIEASKYVEEFEKDREDLIFLHEEFHNLKLMNFGENSRLVSFYSDWDELATDEFKGNTGIANCKDLSNLSHGDAVLMRYVPFAELMEEEITGNGANVIVDGAQKEYLSDIRNWYTDLRDFTPKTWNSYDDVDEEGPYFCKGEDKSLKIDFWKYCYAEDKNALKTTLSNLKEALPGDQEIVIRKFIPLKNYGNSPSTGMPISHEFRTFVFMGTQVSTGFYWEEFASEYGLDLDLESPPNKFINKIINKVGVKANYYTIDTALTVNGDWILIELNSGAQAGLSGINSEKHYQKMNNIWNNL